MVRFGEVWSWRDRRVREVRGGVHTSVRSGVTGGRRDNGVWRLSFTPQLFACVTIGPLVTLFTEIDYNRPIRSDFPFPAPVDLEMS